MREVTIIHNGMGLAFNECLSDKETRELMEKLEKFLDPTKTRAEKRAGIYKLAEEMRQ